MYYCTWQIPNFTQIFKRILKQVEWPQLQGVLAPTLFLSSFFSNPMIGGNENITDRKNKYTWPFKTEDPLITTTARFPHGTVQLLY